MTSYFYNQPGSNQTRVKQLDPGQTRPGSNQARIKPGPGGSNQTRVKRRNLHEPNLMTVWVDSDN